MASENSSFAFTEARLGLAPAIISLTVLPRLDQRAASRYFLTGERFDAQVAERIGLVTVASSDVVAVTDDIVRDLLLCSPQGLRASKALTTASVLASFDSDAASLAELSGRLFESDDAREGVASFLEKRSPRWVTDVQQAD